MLGAPAHPDGEVAGRTGRASPSGWAGRRRGLRRSNPDARLRGADPDRRVGEVLQESARTALSWLRANAGRYGLDSAFHWDADVHLHEQLGAWPRTVVARPLVGKGTYDVGSEPG